MICLVVVDLIAVAALAWLRLLDELASWLR